MYSCICIVTSPASISSPFSIRSFSDSISAPFPQSGRESSIRPPCLRKFSRKHVQRGRVASQLLGKILGMEDVLRILEGFQVLGRSVCYFGMAVLALSIDSVDQGRVT